MVQREAHFTEDQESSTPRTLLLGILTPYAGGFYYGSIIKGIHNTASAAGVSTFAIQSDGLDVMGEGDAEEVLALRAADGWVVVNEAGSHPLVDRLIAEGVPVVAVNASRRDISLCSVLPANQSGTYDLVKHLIEHGHQRIAFAGNREQFDIDERYLGYKKALEDAGLEVFEELGYRGRNDQDAEAREFGRKLASKPFHFTAIAAGTDRVAIGILEELVLKGIRVPEDVAIVGFDDIEKSQYTEPSLTTVRQNFAVVGSRGAQLLLDQLQGSVPLPSVSWVEVPFVQRRSCGCAIAHAAPQLPASDRSEADVLWLKNSLLELAGEPRGFALRESEWPQATSIALRLNAVAEGKPWAMSPGETWRTTWKTFGQHNRTAESVNRALALLEAYVRDREMSPDARSKLTDLMLEFRAALLLSWQQAEQRRTREYEVVAETMARISHTISSGGSGLDLAWMQVTSSSYGTLGLWSSDEDGSRRLLVQREYQGTRFADDAAGETFVPAEFPPRWLPQEINDRSSDQILMIVPLRGGEKDYGVLAVGSGVDAELLDHVVHIGDWGAQIGSSLDQAKIAERLRDHAFRDDLTGLPNRAALLEYASSLIEVEEGPDFALLFLDLDDFKKVNDGLGHRVGDSFLIQIAERLQGSALEHQMVARLGADEFVIVLPGCSSEALVDIAVGKIQEQLAIPLLVEGSTTYVSASIGVAFGKPGGTSAADLLRGADTAMYRAKLRGRGQHAIFQRSMHEQAVERLQFEEQIRKAILEDEFELAFQPIVAIDTGRIIGAEALIRWNHPEQGYLMPGRFIGVAEEVGLIAPLGEWVMLSACREAARWRSAGFDIYVSVNVAADQVKDTEFLEKMSAVLEESGLDGPGLCVEILESSLVEHIDAASLMLSKLRKLGIRVAIDDFGTGYSSLNYLKRLPVDVLKLDRSFIMSLPASREDAAIVSAVLTMGRGLGLKVVAEGIETVAQADFLSDEGCSLAQGYLFQRPLPLGKWRELLKEASPALLEGKVPARRQSSPPLAFVHRPRRSTPPK